ncbi:MMPL family transporter [Actinomycetaceae bacterium WB03_NA08]|uniref:MMPL family transporter n=1 Tax=Scrofimicrobium canadense TaxID=2652290 RepID=A0A6N7VW58_9ACTO|nr:MMPL family transporter [Scrofimicrobium canadense]MSS85230.1 MMPL family transporter [Scrofimicrobium canadense]
MASFLYRLGKLAYRQRRWFLAAWIVILLGVGTSAALFMGTFSENFRLPGTQTQATLDRMKEIFPDAAKVSGSVVFESSDGTPLTAQQQKAISAALASLPGKHNVTSAIDPFEQQEQIDSAASEVADGKAEIEKNAKKLEDGKKQLEDAKKQLESGKKLVAENEPRLKAAAEQLESGQAELDAARTQLEQGQAEYDAGLAQYNQGWAELQAGKDQLAAGQAQFDAGKKQYEERLAAAAKEFDVGANYSEVEAALSAAEAALPERRATLENELDKAKQGLKLYQGCAAGIVTPELCEPPETLKDKIKAAEGGIKELTGLIKEVDQAKIALPAQKAQLAEGKKQLDASEAQLAAGWAQSTQGEEQLAAAKQQLDAAAVQLSDGWAQLEAGQAELDAGRAQYEEGKTQLEQGKKDIAKGEKEIPKAEKELADGEKQLAEGREQLALGERTASATEGLRFVSEDGTTAIAQLSFDAGMGGLSDESRDGLMADLASLESDGINVMYSAEIVTTLDGLIGIGEVIGLLLAAVVLFVMMGTLVAAGLPLLMALVGVGVGVGGTLALSSAIEVMSITPILALMLGLAVGIDYTLFIVHRHRQQLLKGMEPEESVGRAIGTSGNAVVFAGLTVVIALVALVVPGLPFLSILGLSAAATIAIAVLVAITLTPAMLGFIGKRIVSKRAYAKEKAHAEAVASGAIDVEEEETRSRNRGWGAFTTRQPAIAALASVALLGVLAIPTLSMRTALPDGGQEPYGSTAQRAYETISERFGGGYNGPMVAMVDLPEGLSTDEATNTMLDVADEIRPLEGVVAVLPAGLNDDNTAGLLQIVPTGGPASIETENLVHTLRDNTAQIQEVTNTEVNLAGQVAMQIDVSQKVTEALTPYLIIVVGLSLILLLLVFRSVVIPLLATAGFLLSLAAAFGTTVAVYQWGWLGNIFDVHTPGPILSFLPILLTGILFGLAMDYQVFLVSAMREAHAHGAPPVRAVRRGFRASGPVVTAAALIMASVFAGFVFSHLTMVRPLGFGLAIGVLADAFVVRMTLTPAVMSLLGKWAWYIPRWLDKILPNVDVEGTKLAALEDKELADTLQK